MKRPWLGAALLPLLAAGCATRGDLRELRTDMQTGREEMLREMQQQNRALLDSLGAARTLVRAGTSPTGWRRSSGSWPRCRRSPGRASSGWWNCDRQIDERRGGSGSRRRGRAGYHRDRGLGRGGPCRQRRWATPEELFNSLASPRSSASRTRPRAQGSGSSCAKLPPATRSLPDALFYIGEAAAAGERPGRRAPCVRARGGAVPRLRPGACRPVPRGADRGGAAATAAEARTLFNQVVRAYPKSAEAAIRQGAAPLARDRRVAGLSMRCPFCHHAEDRVVDSRTSREGRAVRRRRECLRCERRFTTYEYIEERPLTVRKSDGETEPYDRRKLLRSIQIACGQTTGEPRRDRRPGGGHRADSGPAGHGGGPQPAALGRW